MKPYTRPEFMEPLLLSWPRLPRPAECFERERQQMVHEKQHDPWAECYPEEGSTYEECFCEGCGYQLNGAENTYCHDCVYTMDQDSSERAMKAKKSCGSCGVKFKETPVGIRCKCELMTHGRYVAAGK
jgi:hypothetical protein